MWRLAWRNLWRNRTRTAITGSAIALGLALQLVSYGTADSMYVKMLGAAEQAAGGNVLVHGKGYWSSKQVERIVPNATALAEQIRGVAGVKAVIPRVFVTGLLSTARGNAGAQLIGLVPEAEKALDDKARFVKTGTFLGPGSSKRGAKAPIVLGKKIVDDLKLSLGERVIVTATDPAGEVTRLAFELVGIVETGSDLLDAAAAWTTLAALQEQLGLGDAVTQLGVMLDDDSTRAATAQTIAALLARTQSMPKDQFEVMTWDEAMPEMLQFVELDKQWSAVMGLFIFIVVAFGIANTFLMALLERVRELGLLSALGLTPARMAQLLVIESLLLAAVSIAVGVALAFGLHSIIAHYGIDFAELSGGAEMQMSGVVMEDMVIYSTVTTRWISACLAVLVLVMLSAVYPAIKAMRTEPAEAMRTYE